jgi:hypothetical protein
MDCRVKPGNDTGWCIRLHGNTRYIIAKSSLRCAHPVTRPSISEKMT